jgi:hypothetical protein
LQKDGVHHAKNCRIRSDAEGDRQDSDRREAGIFAQHARAETDILPDGFDPYAGATAADFFLQLLRTAQVHARGAASFGWIHALRHFFVLKQIGAAADFGVEVALDMVAAEEIAG